MKVKKLSFVAIPVTDVKRARAFYEGVLDLQVSDEMMDGNWVEYDLGGDTLAIASVGGHWTPSDQGTAAALEVENFDDAIQKLKSPSSASRPNHLKLPVATWRSCRIPTGTRSSFTN